MPSNGRWDLIRRLKVNSLPLVAFRKNDALKVPFPQCLAVIARQFQKETWNSDRKQIFFFFMADVTCRHFTQHCGYLFRRKKVHYLATLHVTTLILLKAKFQFITHHEMTEGECWYSCTFCLTSTQDVVELTRRPGDFTPGNDCGWAPGPVQYSVHQDFCITSLLHSPHV